MGKEQCGDRKSPAKQASLVILVVAGFSMLVSCATAPAKDPAKDPDLGQPPKSELQP